MSNPKSCQSHCLQLCHISIFFNPLLPLGETSRQPYCSTCLPTDLRVLSCAHEDLWKHVAVNLGPRENIVAIWIGTGKDCPECSVYLHLSASRKCICHMTCVCVSASTPRGKLKVCLGWVVDHDIQISETQNLRKTTHGNKPVTYHNATWIRELHWLQALLVAIGPPTGPPHQILQDDERWCCFWHLSVGPGLTSDDWPCFGWFRFQLPAMVLPVNQEHITRISAPPPAASVRKPWSHRLGRWPSSQNRLIRGWVDSKVHQWT